MGKIKITDIAKQAGLSITAVSLILNNKPCRISEEKKALVRDIAQKNHYVANQVARSLATNKTNMLALILPDIQNIFFSSLASIIELSCREQGYSLLITTSHDLYKDDKTLLRNIETRGVDGIFYIPGSESYQNRAKLIKQLDNMTVPYVMVDRTFSEINCDKVRFDNEEGAYQAVTHLLTMGHRKIACVYRPDPIGNSRSRLDGYLKAMKEFDCEVKESYLQEGDYRFAGGYNAACKILDSDTTATFICNDMMTIGFLKKLFEMKLKVPRDYSIVSYDDSLKDYLLEVELTTIAQNTLKLGETACKLLIERLDGKRKEASEIVFQPELIIRNSVKHISS